MNHCISFSCSSLLRVEGWNSLSTHFSAAAMSAQDAAGDRSAKAATVPRMIFLIPIFSSLALTPVPRPASSRMASHPSKHGDGVDEREAESPPQVRTNEPEPCEVNEGAAEQRNEQPIASCRIKAEHTVARATAGRGPFPHGHSRQREQDAAEERRCLPGPCHPGEIHYTLPRAKPLAM